MKKVLKFSLLTMVSLFVLMVLTVWLAPAFFKGKLIEVVKTEINNRIEGEVDFEDMNVTWWRTFPDVAVDIVDLKLTGAGRDSTRRDLLKAQQLSLGFDFMSVWSQGDSLEINSFRVLRPEVFLYVSPEGKANYQLVAGTDSLIEENVSETPGIKFDLSDYAIEDADIYYLDRSSGLEFKLISADHNGSLTYEADRLLLNAVLSSSDVTMAQVDVAYLRHGEVHFDGVLDFNLNENKYSFLENSLKLNALELFFEGAVQIQEEGIDLDVSLNTRKNEFKSLLSLLPNMYTEDFNTTDVRGQIEIGAVVKGRFNEKEGLYPAYKVDANVTDGWFQLPDKSLALADIQFSGRMENTPRTLSPVLIQIPEFSFVLNEEKMEGHLMIESRNSNQYFDGGMNGTLSLADLLDAYPMPTIQSMSGSVDLDVLFKGNTRAVENSDFSELDYKGYINGNAIKVAMEGQPSISIEELKATVDRDAVVISEVRAKVGRSDVEGSGRIYPIAKFLVDDETPIHTEIQLTGNRFDINELMGAESKHQEVANDQSENPMPVTSGDILSQFHLDLDGEFNEVIYDQYELKNVSAQIDGTMDDLNIDLFKAEVAGDPIQLKGRLTNMSRYLEQEGVLKGDLFLKASSFNADYWVGTEGEEEKSDEEENTSFARVPDDIDVRLHLDVNEMTYDGFRIDDAKGMFVVKENRLLMSEVSGKTLGGRFSLDGYYEYDGRDEPLFKLAYGMQNFSFEETFKQVETAPYLLPVIKFLEGSFNTDMVFEGSLKPGYMPNLMTLSGQGLLETLHANISNSETLNRIADLVGIDDLKKLNLDRSRNRFKVNNGRLDIEPFEESIEGINARFSGHHFLTGDMDYKIALAIPTEKFNVKGIPVNIKDQFSSVQNQLKKFGLPLEDTETIRVDVLLTGPINQPKIGVKLVDFSKQSVKDAVDAAAKELVEQAKDSVTNTANREAIKLIQGDQQDSTQTSVTEAAKDRVKDEVNKTIEEEVQPMTDTLISDVKKAIDKELQDAVDEETRQKAKDLLDEWNPFKKKKKDD